MVLVTYEKINLEGGRAVFAIVAITDGQKLHIDDYRTKAAAIRNLPKYTKYINDKIYKKLQTV